MPPKKPGTPSTKGPPPGPRTPTSSAGGGNPFANLQGEAPSGAGDAAPPPPPASSNPPQPDGFEGEVVEAEHPDLRKVKDTTGGKGMFPYEDVPPPPETWRRGEAREYRTELDGLKAELVEAREAGAAYEKVWEGIRKLEQRLAESYGADGDPGGASEALLAAQRREDALEGRVHELETLLADAEPHPDKRKYWSRRGAEARDVTEVELQKERERSRAMQRELFMGEAVDTKMAYRLQEIELDNRRLRRANAQLREEVEDREQVLPTVEYLQRLGHLFNLHNNAMSGLLADAEASMTAAAQSIGDAPNQPNFYFSGEVPPEVKAAAGGGEQTGTPDAGGVDPSNPEGSEEGGVGVELAAGEKRRQPGSHLPWRGTVFCGRCNMLVVAEERGSAPPMLVRSRVQGSQEGKGIGLFVGDTARIGYPNNAAGSPRGPPGGARHGGVLAEAGGGPAVLGGLTPAQRMRAEAAGGVPVPPRTAWAAAVGHPPSRHTDESRNAVHRALSPSRVGVAQQLLPRSEAPQPQGMRHTRPNSLVFTQDKNWPGR